MDLNHQLARNVFYKYGIESKIHGTLLSTHLKKYNSRAAIARGKFTKTFKTNPKNQQAYHNFKNYIEKS
jgi:hypothetical protein